MEQSDNKAHEDLWAFLRSSYLKRALETDEQLWQYISDR